MGLIAAFKDPPACEGDSGECASEVGGRFPVSSGAQGIAC